MRGRRVLLPLILILFLLPLAFGFVPAKATTENNLPPNVDEEELVEQFKRTPANQTVTYSHRAPINPSSPYPCLAGKAVCLDITGPSSFFNGLPNSETTTHYVFLNAGIYFWYNSLGSNLTIPILTAQFGTLPVPRLPNSVLIGSNSSAVWYVYGFSYGPNTATITVTLKEKEAFGYLLQDLKQTLSYSFSSYPATITETFLNPRNLAKQTTSTSLTFGRAGYDWKDSPSAVFNSATNSVSWVVNLAGIIDPTTIGTTTNVNAIRFAYQSKTCFANTRYWVFYYDGTNIVFRSSTDGTTWSGTTNYDTTNVPTEGAQYGISCSGSTMLYISSDAAGKFYAKGDTLNSGGTITSIFAKVTVTTTNIDAGVQRSAFTDGTNYWAIAMTYNSAVPARYHVELWQCSTTCGTASNWTNRQDYNTGQGADNYNAEMFTVTSGIEVIMGVLSGGAQPLIVLNNPSADGSGTWSATATSSNSYLFFRGSGAAIGNTVYYCGVQGTTKVVLVKVTYGTPPTINEATTIVSTRRDTCVMETDGVATLVAISERSNSQDYYISTDTGATWSGANNIGTDTLSDVEQITGSPSLNGNTLFVAWLQGAGPNYNVRFQATLLAVIVD